MKSSEAELIEVKPGEWKVVDQQVDPKPEWRWACPKCKARVGEPCIYLTDLQRWDTRWVTDSSGHKSRREVQTILHRKGDTTDRSHNERSVMRHRQEQRRKPIPVVGPSPGVRALWDYDRIEYRTMQGWLRENWRIFQ